MMWKIYTVLIFTQLLVYKYMYLSSAAYKNMQFKILSASNAFSPAGMYLDVPGEDSLRLLPRLDYGAYGPYSLAVCLMVQDIEKKRGFRCPDLEP